MRCLPSIRAGVLNPGIRSENGEQTYFAGVAAGVAISPPLAINGEGKVVASKVLLLFHLAGSALPA